MHVLIFGTTGKVGSEVERRFAGAGHYVFAPLRPSCDFRHPAFHREVARMIRNVEAQVVINCVAMNGMEACAADPTGAYLANAAAPGAIAEACGEVGALFVHLSTDYVFFSDRADLTEDTPLAPRSTYGMSKAVGEGAVERAGGRHLIFRLSSIYGRDWSGPLDCIRQMVELGRGLDEANPVKVLQQWCAPTSARLIADAIFHAVKAYDDSKRGTYHIASNGGMWKHEFAHLVLERVGAPKREGADIVPGRIIACGELPIPRPIFSRLIVSKFEDIFGYRLPSPEDDFLATMPLIRTT